MTRTRGFGFAWALALTLPSLGCQTAATAGRGATRAPSADDLAGISLEELVVRPSGAAALRYGESTSHPHTPIEAAIGDAMAREGIEPLPALSAMVRELVRTTPEQINVPPHLVDALMSWAGLVDPPPRLVVVELGGDRAGCDQRPSAACSGAIESILEQVRGILRAEDLRATGADLRFGVGVVGMGGGRTRMMVALMERSVVLDPLDARVSVGDTLRVRGRLQGPRKQPHVEVIHSDGRWNTAPVALSTSGAFDAEVVCASPGALQIEVLAEGPHGPEVVANFPVYCGAVPPSSFTVVVERLGPDVTADQIARANFIYLNEERRRRGLAVLAWDPKAVEVALGHSEDMRSNGFVGHRSPTTGDVTARFDRAGITGAVIRENVARGYGPKGIHDSLMRSPGHRVNILAPDVTHAGVGAVLGAPETNVLTAPRPVFATQNFYKKPGAGAPAERDLASTVRDRVDVMRRDAGLTPMMWDEKLALIAAQQAAVLGRGREPAAGFETAVFDLGYISVESHRVQSIDFDALTTAELWREESAKAAVGVGVVRVRATRTQDEGFLAVVLVAGKP